jgi:hypothetical protein
MEANPREISTCTTEPQTQILVSKDHQNSEGKTKRWMKNRPGGDPKQATLQQHQKENCHHNQR